MNICAIVPAAGTGSRLKSDCPKIFTEVVHGKTIWDILSEKLLLHVSKVNVVLNSTVQEDYGDKVDNEKIFISNQDVPLGMGDAIFQGYEIWKEYDYILVVWGDQVHVSNKTFKDVLSKVSAEKECHMIIPVSSQQEPYVEYIFDNDKTKLLEIRQSREGDTCAQGGLSDLGVFCLSTKKIKELWSSYLNKNEKGQVTGEINFLPFLTYLSLSGWEIDTVVVDDPIESRGINTPDDLMFFKDLYEKS